MIRYYSIYIDIIKDEAKNLNINFDDIENLLENCYFEKKKNYYYFVPQVETLERLIIKWQKNGFDSINSNLFISDFSNISNIKIISFIKKILPKNFFIEGNELYISYKDFAKAYENIYPDNNIIDDFIVIINSYKDNIDNKLEKRNILTLFYILINCEGIKQKKFDEFKLLY